MERTIEDMTSRANQSLDILNALKHKLDRVTLERLYYAFVRSKLEYGSIIWDNCTDQLSDLLESVQYRAAKIVSGGIHRVSHNIVYKELGWETLKERRRKQRLKVFYKAVKKDTPKYLSDQVPNPVQNERYNLRGNELLVVPESQTRKFENSFFPQTTKEWNELDEETKLSPTFESFKHNLDKNISKPPVWFTTGERRLNVLHSKMRMLCSSLNDHLYSHIHVIDNPTCACGHVRENNKHYLHDCHLFNNERMKMLAELHKINFDPTVQNLLNGDSESDTKTNIKAFEIIQTFIDESQRFKAVQ